MLNATCGKVCQNYSVLGLGTASLELMSSIPSTLWVQNSTKLPELGFGVLNPAHQLLGLSNANV